MLNWSRAIKLAVWQRNRRRKQQWVERLRPASPAILETLEELVAEAEEHLERVFDRRLSLVAVGVMVAMPGLAWLAGDPEHALRLAWLGTGVLGPVELWRQWVLAEKR